MCSAKHTASFEIHNPTKEVFPLFSAEGEKLSLNDIGTPVEVVRLFGTKQDFQAALRDMTSKLYT